LTIHAASLSLARSILDSSGIALPCSLHKLAPVYNNSRVRTSPNLRLQIDREKAWGEWEGAKKGRSEMSRGARAGFVTGGHEKYICRSQGRKTGIAASRTQEHLSLKFRPLEAGYGKIHLQLKQEFASAKKLSLAALASEQASRAVSFPAANSRTCSHVRCCFS
jgi:hypothetical protein